MAKYTEVLFYFLLFLALTIIDLALYYSWGPKHSLVPLFVSSALTIVVGVVTGLATYEVFKHRNDKEPW